MGPRVAGVVEHRLLKEKNVPRNSKVIYQQIHHILNANGESRKCMFFYFLENIEMFVVDLDFLFCQLG